MQRTTYILVGLLVACGSGRPEGAETDGATSIVASATVDGATFPDGGVTASESIVIAGSVTDRFGLESASYSWNGGALLPLDLDSTGEFTLTLDLQKDGNEFKIEATSLAPEEGASLALAYFRDTEPPLMEAPTTAFAASIISESEMDLEKTATTMSLSGGESVPVRDGVAFSKYSSRYGLDQPNRPVWRFNVADNYSEALDSRLEFSILRDGTELVPWTPASAGGEEADFTVTISSTLNERLGEESGVYSLEVRAIDAVGNMSAVTALEWTQTILNPPIFIATGGEDIMGLPGGPKDPRSAVLADNFSTVVKTAGLEIGSFRIGNPNDVPVLISLDSSMTGISSYSYRRSNTALAVMDPPGATCGSLPTRTSSSACYDTVPSLWGRPRQRRFNHEDQVNVLPALEVRDVSGSVVSTGPSFVMEPHTEYFAIATLASPMSNVLPSLQEMSAAQGSTSSQISLFYICQSPVDNFTCNQWALASDFNQLIQFYATWDLAARVESKVNLDLTSTTPFQPADPNAIVGYSRVLATSFNAAIPQGHDDIATGF